MGRGNSPFWYEYGQSQRRCVVIGKVPYLVPQIEHPHASVGADAGENLRTAPRDVVHLFVVRDKLRVHGFFFDVPNRARRVQ